MNYEFVCSRGKYLECIEKLESLVANKNFVDSIRVDGRFYRFDYEIRVDKTTNNAFCIEPLRESVTSILTLLQEHAEKIKEIVNKLAGLSRDIGGKVYPSSLIWKSSQEPAGLDLAYSLALHSKDYLTTMGDYLLSTDPNHSVYELPCIESLVEKYGILPDTLYLLASYCLHGTKGFDYLISLVEESKHSKEIGDSNSVKLLKIRMDEIDSMAGGRYEDSKEEILEIIANS